MAETARWYRIAADGGSYLAQYRLGLLYQRGEGVPRDLDEAIRLFELAAKQGWPPAKKCVRSGYVDCPD